MPNVFKSITDTGVGASLTTVYTCPASTTAVVIGCNVSNTTGGQITVDLKLNKNVGDDVFVVKNIPIPNGSSYEFIAGSKLVLETADTLEVQSSAATSVDVIVSVLESS
jgi:hypothetical protein